MSSQIRLPLMREIAVEQETVVPAPSTSARMDGLSVLLAADDVPAKEALAHLLRGLGAHIQTANSAEEALACLAAGSFDILISDLAMPGADGYALLRSVRAREGDRRRIYALALTGLASIHDRDSAIEAGFDDHLPKPVNLQLLLEKLSLWRGR
ncbi:response regulator [Burkholderia contaminans]|uniref:response regulator n=1 Tax=Burkholderia contaminans TaxID=488447 RepID=UPI00115FAA48|nr:response regulator [Burkholderia contaminans]